MSFKHEIRASPVKNRLYLRLEGTMGEEEARMVRDTILGEIKKLKQGCTRVVRVVGEQTITNMQWNRTLKETQGMRADNAPTVADAERMLDNG